METTLLRAQGALFQQMPDGHFSNLYTVRVVNKTSREMPVELKLENPAGELQVMGQEHRRAAAETGGDFGADRAGPGGDEARHHAARGGRLFPGPPAGDAQDGFIGPRTTPHR